MTLTFLVQSRSIVVHWSAQGALGSFPYVCGTGEIVSIPARNVPYGQWSADESIVSKWVGAVSVSFKDGVRITLQGARVAKQQTLGPDEVIEPCIPVSVAD